jgi:maltose O-acetyltransferase
MTNVSDLQVPSREPQQSTPFVEPVENLRSLRSRVESTLQAVMVHCVHLLSNLFGDDVLSRMLRAKILRLAGARIGGKSCIKGGTYVSNPSNLKVGSNVMINRNCYLDLQGPLVLGDFVGLGHGTSVITTVHPVVPGMNVGIGMTGKAVTVGDRVWIGANVTVMPGVTIGDDAIISVGTVLMRDVPPNSVVAGVPGQVVRQNVKPWVVAASEKDSASN